MSNQMQSSTPAPAAPASSGGGQGLAIASLVLGILSLCGSGVIWCGGVLGLVGLILGILGINTRGRTMAIAGVILSAVGLVLVIVFRVIFRGVLLNGLMHRFLPGSGF
jgi:hypothetical protein